MFSLVIVLISIALVAGLALATIYYMGGGWNSASVSAQTSRLLNESEQIQGAIALFRADHQRLPTTLEELTVDGAYLRQLPPGVWQSNQAFIQTSADHVNPDVCLAFNQQRNVPLIPTCDDPAYQAMVVCCSLP
jgi:type II secretory pathway pseudopilin PulG